MSTRPVALVTGANKGIGLQVAKDLFAKGYSVVLGCRDVGKGRDAMTEIAKPYEEQILGAGHKLSVIKLDLADGASIPAAVEEYKRYNDRLDVLVNNAGVYSPNAATTVGTNFFATMAVTEAFLPLLAAPKPNDNNKNNTAKANGRIVVVSSRMGILKSAGITEGSEAFAVLGKRNAEDLSIDAITALGTAFVEAAQKGDAAACQSKLGLSPNNVYANSKALISAYSRALAVRLAKSEQTSPQQQQHSSTASVTVNVTCPGYTKTDMTNNKGFKTVAEGAETITWVASDEAFEGVSGKFFGDHKEMSFFE